MSTQTELLDLVRAQTMEVISKWYYQGLSLPAIEQIGQVQVYRSEWELGYPRTEVMAYRKALVRTYIDILDADPVAVAARKVSLLINVTRNALVRGDKYAACIDTARALANDRLSGRRIAKEFGMSSGVITQWLNPEKYPRNTGHSGITRRQAVYDISIVRHPY